MEVVLPNGTVLEGIPEGTNKFSIMEKAISSGLAKPEDFGQEAAPSAAAESAGGRFLEGIGRGMSNVGRQVGNIVGLVDDERIEEMEALDKDLMDTGWGTAGSIVGEIAATAPVGGVTGALGKGAAAARGAGMLPQAVARGLASPITRGAVEGAAVGAVLGGPGERGSTAAMTGAFGGGFGAAGRLLGNAWRNFRVTSPITAEARATQEATGHFIPLSQALPEGSLWKNFYEGIVANFPGGAGRIRGQYRDALDDVRNYIATQAHPERAHIFLEPEDTLPMMMGKLDDYWKTAYDDIGDEIVDLSRVRISDAMRRSIDDISGGTFTVPTGRVAAREALQLKNGIRELMDEIPKGSVLQRGLRAPMDDAIKSIDDTLMRELPEELADAYASKGPAYKNYMDLIQAMKGAAGQGGEFSMSGMTGAAFRRGGREAMSGGTELQQVATNAMKALPDFPSKQGIFQVTAALGLTGSILGGVGVPVGAGLLSTAALMRKIASPGFQKLISGQHSNAAKLEAYKEFLRLAGYSARQIASVIEAETANASRR